MKKLLLVIGIGYMMRWSYKVGYDAGKNDGTWGSAVDETQERGAAALGWSIRRIIEEAGYIDIGSGAEKNVGGTVIDFLNVIDMLVDQGYERQYIKVRNLNTGRYPTLKYTTLKILTKPGISRTEAYAFLDHYSVNEETDAEPSNFDNSKDAE